MILNHSPKWRYIQDHSAGLMAAKICDPPMTIGASNVALFDLGHDISQRAASRHPAHVGNFDTSNMIKFKDYGITLAAVYARMRCQVTLYKVLASLIGSRSGRSTTIKTLRM